MNEEERIKEFEERELSQLISDLRDINTYTSFKNGAYIYDLGHYQGQLLLQEIERLNNSIKQKDNTLKEIREYMNKHEIEEVYLDCKLYETQAYKDILEILDKGSDKE